MAIYFDEYNHEIFTSRTHTASLGKLILALDEPCSFQDPAEAVRNVKKCVVFSGLFDFMTGVYLSTALCKAVNAGLVEGGAKGTELVGDRKLRGSSSSDNVSNTMDGTEEATNLDQLPTITTEYTALPTTSTLKPHTTS
eukprot:gene21100-27067_t